MFEEDFAATVEESLGFYPSYIAAVSEYPAYRSLLWRETQRVVTAPWAGDAAAELARAAQSSVDAAVPDERLPDVSRVSADEAALDSTVRFFSFVVFRLGLGITACRYALDGPETLRAHRRALPETESTLGARIERGVESTPSLDFAVSLVHPSEADDVVTAAYDRVLTELKTPNVNNIFRALAASPATLSTVVDAQVALYDAVESRAAFERRLRGWYATVLAANDAPANHRAALRAEGYGREDVDAVAATVRAYHENLPTLVTTLLLARQLTAHDDPSSKPNEQQ
ncbi:MAG: hypothetical protein ABEJ79_02740 [Halolamina sp.]